MRAFVASGADEASLLQRDALLALGTWTDDGPFGAGTAWRRGDVRLVTIAEHHLYRDFLDRDLEAHFGARLELVVYLSKHKSASREPSLTVHPVGNPRGADFGGVPGRFAPAAPPWMTAALRRLRDEAKGLPYAVTFEATHHGPLVGAPTFYIEQGSTEREWADVEASRAIARTLLALEPAGGPVAIGLGGGHYVPRHTDVALGRRVTFGHLLPAYALEGMDPAVLGEARATSPGATLAYVHRKSLSKAGARAWEERLGALGLEVVHEADLAPREGDKGS